MPRARSSATTFCTGLAGTLGMMRGAASIMTKCRSERATLVALNSNACAMSSSSEMVSTLGEATTNNDEGQHDDVLQGRTAWMRPRCGPETQRRTETAFNGFSDR